MSRRKQLEIVNARGDTGKGVKGKINNPEEMRRKGEFLVRTFGNPRGRLLTDSGKSTVLALKAKDWGEQVPKNAAAAHRLARKGQVLLKKYHQLLKKRQAD